jgi:signal transduction histidine kinase
VARYENGTDAIFVGRWSALTTEIFPGDMRLELTDDSAVARVFRFQAPAWLDSYEDVESAVSRRMREHGFRRAAAAPVTVAGRLWGAVVVAATRPETLQDGATERRLESFAQIVSLALASADAREQLLASRKRLVQVADEERRRLERDLHDGAQQRLVALTHRLHLALKFLGSDDERVREQLDVCALEVREAIDDLRRVANGLHPPVLTEAGLPAALRALARRSPLPVTLRSAPERRFAAEIETAVYYLVSEALTNTVKHAGATAASVDVRSEDGRLVVEVADDGRGGADPAQGSGLRGLNDRVEAVGGTLVITSGQAGTTVQAAFPVESPERL